MAHFAELNSSNEVLRVIVVSNEDVDANGGDQHADAETFVTTIVPHSTGGVAWKQCSYNNNFRKQFGGVGCTYDKTNDIFVAPKPFTSWTLGASHDWQPPTAYPDDDKYYSWDEDTTSWKEIT